MAIAVVLVSIIQSIRPFIIYSFKAINFKKYFAIREQRIDYHNRESTTDTKEQKYRLTSTYKMTKSNFIHGLLLSLELESGNAILKMGVFTSALAVDHLSSTVDSVQSHTLSNSLLLADSGFSNFIFFVIVLTVRIAMNQTLRRFS